MSLQPAGTARWRPPHAPQCLTECRERKSFRHSVREPEISPILVRNNSRIAYLIRLPPPLLAEQTLIQQSHSGVARPTDTHPHGTVPFVSLTRRTARTLASRHASRGRCIAECGAEATNAAAIVAVGGLVMKWKSVIVHRTSQS